MQTEIPPVPLAPFAIFIKLWFARTPAVAQDANAA
jgi:hypothetical protein